MRVLALSIALLLPGCMTEERPQPERQQAAKANPATATKAVAKAGGTCGDEAEGSCCGGGSKGVEGAKGTSCGCQGKQAAKPGQTLTPSVQAKVGDRTTCVVSGGKFVVRPNTVFVSHEGKTYPVCCPGCAVRFNQNPKRFLET